MTLSWLAGQSEERYRHEVEHGALFVGSPETVAQKVARAMSALGAETFDLMIVQGTQDAQLRAIELFGTQVAPRVRELLAELDATAAQA